MDRRAFVGLSLAALAADAGEAAAPGDVPKINLKHAFSLSIFFKERIRIDSPGGRVFVPTVGGEIWGPRLQGKVVPYGGADYAGGHGFDAHYALQASDGALIYIRNRGYMKRLGDPPGPGVSEPPPRKPGEPLNQTMQGGAGANVPLRFRITPLFDAPEGPHDWLNRTLIIGHGARYSGPDHTIFSYYEVL